MVNVPAAGTVPCATEAPSETSLSTRAAAEITSTVRSVTEEARTSQTCLPSGSATWAPGTRVLPPDAIFVLGQNSLRRNVVTRNIRVFAGAEQGREINRVPVHVELRQRGEDADRLVLLALQRRDQLRVVHARGERRGRNLHQRNGIRRQLQEGRVPASHRETHRVGEVHAVAHVLDPVLDVVHRSCPRDRTSPCRPSSTGRSSAWCGSIPASSAASSPSSGSICEVWPAPGLQHPRELARRLDARDDRRDLLPAGPRSPCCVGAAYTATSTSGKSRARCATPRRCTRQRHHCAHRRH